MSGKKRQKIPGGPGPGLRPGLWPGLWIVATPIGNLEDLTPRARQALEDASGVLCEDTRRAAELYSALGIAKPQGGFTRLDAHAGSRALEAALARLQAGENLALVTDAGTPAVSDPGAEIVSAALRAGIRVTPLPGASAVATLLSASGVGGGAFVFRGFFPRKPSERAAELELAEGSAAARTWIWFESPHRIVESLEAIAKIAVLRRLSGKIRLVVGKELTKLHERIFAGSPEEITALVSEEIAREGALGEWSFLLHFDVEPTAESSDWVKALRCLIDARVPASEAARRVSQLFGAPRNIVYASALELSAEKS